MDRRPVHTKILATLGPTSSNREILAQMIEKGADAFRLNFSHADPTELTSLLQKVRDAASQSGCHAAIVGDLCGPKVRLGNLAPQEEGHVIEPGNALTIQKGIERGERGRVGINEERVIDEAQIGDRFLIDDGAIRLVVSEKSQDALLLRCTTGGPLYSRKGVNLPDTQLSLEVLTDVDRTWVKWSMEHQLDFLALSYVRSAQDIESLRSLLRKYDDLPQIIAKIEHPSAVNSIDTIIEASDAIMIARGDLGVEMDVARVPLIQKDIIRRCTAAQKPVIVATQMLQSMIDAPRPTRAEVSDVSNAIHDGVDAVMLSGETAVGRYPVIAVETMNRIADVSERHLFAERTESSISQARDPKHMQEMAIALGAYRMARSLEAKAIVTLSRGGGMARLFASLRPTIPVLALSESERVLRRMALLFGVIPLTCEVTTELDGFLPRLDALLRDHLHLKREDAVLIVGGLAADKPTRPNAVMIYHVGESDAR